MSSRFRWLLFAALAVAATAFVKRPVQPPTTEGSWHPADSTRSHR